MIPKKIHYCWFGNQPKSQLILDCIASWQNYCPDYEIIEWNETNSNLSHPFVKEAYLRKKWAFVSDFVRLEVIQKYGGVYLDTDMMLLKPLDVLLHNKCFFGFEDQTYINASIFGAVKDFGFIKSIHESYDNIIITDALDFNEITIPIFVTKCFKRLLVNHKVDVNNISVFDDIVTYPSSYFYPLPNKNKFDLINYLNYRKEETIAIHLWCASWVVYNEFDYLLQKQYFKAFKIVLERIFFKRDVSLYYFKRLYNHINK